MDAQDRKVSRVKVYYPIRYKLSLFILVWSGRVAPLAFCPTSENQCGNLLCDSVGRFIEII